MDESEAMKYYNVDESYNNLPYKTTWNWYPEKVKLDSLYRSLQTALSINN